MSDEIKVCREDNFAAWMARGNNPDRLPVVQLQTPRGKEYPNNLGGWVLREPSDQPPEGWVQVPLHTLNVPAAEAAAVAEAKRKYYGRHPEARPTPPTEGE